MSDYYWGWFIGVYEGEGSVTLRRHPNTTYMTLKVVSTDKDVIERLKDLVPEATLRSEAAATERHRQKWIWSLTKSAVAKTLAKEMLPYLSQRRQEQVSYAIAETSDLKTILRWLEGPRELETEALETNEHHKYTCENCGWGYTTEEDLCACDPDVGICGRCGDTLYSIGDMCSCDIGF